MENKVSCRANKTLLIDPNTFAGQSSSNNISVPLEDLSIYVQLETTKKARTILNNNGISNTFNSTEGAYVTFIDGDEVARKKVLTTDYVNLTTNLSESNVQQALGISSIDIDFNSSYAPLITINFIDLRGSAIFQNEENIANGQNKYAEFFNLPYPIFTLTVKGYYGMPVKYNLHLTKFNAKFNSQTGNFEITANFIGYTYAMLSDMLIGYLRAIAYTDKGDKKYKQIKESRNGILTLDELAEKISKIDEGVEKLKDSDPDVSNLNRLNSKLDLITSLRSNINKFGENITGNDKITDFSFVFKDTYKSAEDAIKTYNTEIETNVKDFNTEMFSNISLNEKDLKFSNVKFYNGLTIELLNSSGNTLTTELSQATDKVKTKEELRIYATKNVTSNSSFEVYDFREQIELLNVTETNLKNEGNNLKYKVADSLKNTITKELNFTPTIRNIVGSFTAAVEVLMHVLYDVSTEASKSESRKNELEKKFVNSDSNDYKQLSIKNTTSNDASGQLNKNFYPWPEYREADKEVAYIEKYLGDVNGLDPNKIDELIFINDLYQAFLSSAKKINEIEISSELTNTNWIPVNPIDTRLFIETFPYKRIQANTKDEVIALLMERAFIYIGYSNFKLSKEEIIEIANKESESILTLIENDVIKKSLSQLTKNDFINVKAVNDGLSTSLIKKLSGKWYYNFIYEASQLSDTEKAKYKKILPITTNNNKFEYDFIPLEDTKNKQEKGALFLTNYKSSSHLTYNNTVITKEDDGGIYLKVILPDIYKASINPTSTVNESSTLLLNILRLPQEEFNQKFNQVGFNQYSGPYSIQDYKVLDYGDDRMNKAEYRIMFYGGTYLQNNVLSIGSLGYKRKEKATTPYDITGEKIKQFETLQNAIDNTLGENGLHDYLGSNRFLLHSLIEEKSNQISFPFIGFQVSLDGARMVPIGLFGSRLYNQQFKSPYGYSSDYAKALLFLHTLPWNGLYSSQIGAPDGIFNLNEILNTFGNRAGFISAPRLWVAFIGGMLWRADSTKPSYHSNTRIINGGGSGILDPITWYYNLESLIPLYEVTTKVPTKTQYLKFKGENKNTYNTGSMSFPLDTVFGLSKSFIDLENVLLQLPEQVKNEFKQTFFDFVQLKDEESDWSLLKNKLEVYNKNPSDWVNTCNAIFTNINAGGGLFSDGTISKTKMLSEFNAENNGKKTLNEYIIFSPYKDNETLKNNFMTELKDDSEGVNMILDLITQEVYLANTTYRIWQQEESIKPTYETTGPSYEKTSGIFVSDDDLNTFISACTTNFAKQNSQTIDEKNKQIKNEIFGTDNEKTIKFQLYRTCKNIYDKWIGGTDSLVNLMFGKNEFRNGLDKELAGVGKELRLIDSFRFVSRSFKDIGDEFIVNPSPIITFLKENQNSSFYQVVTSLLSSNNFDFIALPSYINFRDETLGNLFKPMTTLDAFNNGEVGPSFVCVYVGQTSKNLNFNSSEYPNDGVDFRCDSDGNLKPTLAKDFYEKNKPYENNVAVFAVNFSQQNQNIFKDITLDQSEFTETAESLKVVDDIANYGSENRRTYGGQNMFNVYSVRSYKAEVEMMGNAMIQPMMYFQLNNIPMFHGAYMITHVKHNIKPNHMSTSFTGVRIRNVETKLIKESEFYMSLLDSIGIEPIDNMVESEPVTENTLPPKSVSGLFVDPFDNDKKVIVSSAPGVRTLHGSKQDHLGADFSIQQGTNLIAIYDGEIDWVKYNYSRGVGYGLYFVITHPEIDGKVYKSVYGHVSELDKKTFGKNISELSKSEINQIVSGYNPKIKVKKGQIIGKSGGTPKQGYLDKVNKNYDLAGGSTGPHLHYELRIGEKQLAKSSFVSLEAVNPIPYLPLANYVTYKGKGGKPIKTKEILKGPNADFWSLIAICSLEAGTPQARADVAQSIYNRLATPNKPYGKSIKEIIVEDGQYEPTFKNKNEWYLINDQNSATIAVMNSKKWTKEQTTKALKETKEALLNETYQKNSRTFIGTRTEFLSEKPSSKEATGVVEREPKSENNAFYWQYAGKSLIDKTPPLATNWAKLDVNTNIS
jgi:murein DD-endopeptidase MepM/ murein hydrolase activator NlpD